MDKDEKNIAVAQMAVELCKICQDPGNHEFKNLSTETESARSATEAFDILYAHLHSKLINQD